MGSPKPRSKLKALGLVLTAICVACAIVLYATRLSWGPGMIITAPSPDYAPIAVPNAALPFDIERAGVHVRAWVLEPDTAVRGTLFLLHGIRDTKLSLLNSAREHARRGFRTVVVDSRGHGESSGQFLTYGVEESRDLRALADALDAQSLLEAPLVVIGTSYGAATAVQYAAIDQRVALTIALAPFASLEEVVPAYVEWIFGPLAALVPGDLVPEVLEESSRLAHFDAAAACPRCVAGELTSPLRLVHSRDDERIPIEHARAIAAAAADVELIELTGVSHNDTGSAEEGQTAIRGWLAEL